MRPIGVGVVIVLVCAALIASARGIGWAHDLPPTYLETGGCDQPCWHGLRPGPDLDEGQIKALLINSPFWLDSLHLGDNSQLIKGFGLKPKSDLTLAQVLHEFGAPEVVRCLSVYPQGMLVRLAYYGETVYVWVYVPGDTPRLLPAMLIDVIAYQTPDTVTPQNQAVVPFAQQFDCSSAIWVSQ